DSRKLGEPETVSGIFAIEQRVQSQDIEAVANRSIVARQVHLGQLPAHVELGECRTLHREADQLFERCRVTPGGGGVVFLELRRGRELLERIYDDALFNARLDQSVAHPLGEVRVRGGQLDESPDEPLSLRDLEAELLHRVANDFDNTLLLETTHGDRLAEIEERGMR